MEDFTDPSNYGLKLQNYEFLRHPFGRLEYWLDVAGCAQSIIGIALASLVLTLADAVMDCLSFPI